MRHRVYGKHLGRDKDQRDILFKGLIRALLSHGTIETTEAKAKSIKGLIDRVINLAKKKNSYRLASFVNDKNLRERLVREIVPKLGSRTSGYTSLTKLGTRSGDQTMMIKMSLIGAEELKPLEKVTGSKVQVTNEKKEEVKKVTPKKKVAVGKPVVRKRLAKKK